ncbi:porin family protein [Pontibacter rugosus]|uniref:Porin family protein n=1 Tax=Pontibacter rugosus TaxID=1745966 RepID=A0ABW3SV67_9BACT
MIDYRGDARSAQVTIFKSSANGEEQRLSPNNIAGYGYENDNKAFETKKVTLDGPLGPETQALFLNVLVKGKASLYYYRNTFDAEFYFLQKDTLFEELVDRIIEKTDPTSGTRYQQKDTKYIGLLRYAFFDCKQISLNQLQNIKINHSDLTRIITKYNACVAPEETVKTFTNRKDKAIITAGPVIMYATSTLDFTGDAYITNADFGRSSNLGGGVFFNLVLPNLNEKLSLQTELLYIPQKFSAATSRNRVTVSEYYEFDLAYLKLPLQLRYTYPKGAVRPYANVGFVINYALKDTNTAVRSSSSTGFFSEGPALPYNGFNRYADGLIAGVGASVPINQKALAIELRYEKNSGVSNVINLGSSIKSYSLMMSYTLF